MNGKRFSGENARAQRVLSGAGGVPGGSGHRRLEHLRRGEQHHRAGKHQLPAGEPAGPLKCGMARRRTAHPRTARGQQPSATPQASGSAQEGSSHSAVNDDPEAPENTASAAQETAGQVEPEPTQQPAESSLQEQVPATAPLYEISNRADLARGRGQGPSTPTAPGRRCTRRP